LSLSQVVECEGSTMRILDWGRLCSVASYEASRLDLSEDEDADLILASEVEDQPQLLTAAGDQACFV
ncbi:MAG TPA: hypothetical protein VD768_03705, partial [Sphingomicrobium sp.]|nr:hypothetical protein [Sphingomicrobium sp.]